MLLVDGVMSGLDSRVAREVMDKAIKGIAGERLVFLVTYDLAQASELDWIMLMEEGRVKELKTSTQFFEELKEGNM